MRSPGLLFVTAFLLLVPFPASAQGNGPRYEFFGAAGGGAFMRSTAQSLGSGLGIGAGVGFHLSSHTSLQLEADWFFPESEPGSLRVRSSVVGSGSLAYCFSDRAVRPYLRAGFGVSHSTQQAPDKREFPDNGFGPVVGGGVAFRVSPSVTIEPEARLYSDLHSTIKVHVVQGLVRIAFHW